MCLYPQLFIFIHLSYPNSVILSLSCLLSTLHFILFTLHSILQSPKSIPYSFLLTPYSLLLTHYSLLLTPHSLVFTLYSLLFTLYSLLFTLYSLLFTLYSLILLLSPYTYSSLYVRTQILVGPRVLRWYLCLEISTPAVLSFWSNISKYYHYEMSRHNIINYP